MLAILFGLSASACLILSSISLQRKRILVLGLAINVFAGLQYLVLEEMGALILLSISFIMTATVMLSLKYQRLGSPAVLLFFLSIYPVAFFLVNESISSFMTLLPLVATMLATVAFFLRNVILVKALFISVGISWLTFQFGVGAYGQIGGEVVTLTGNIISLVLLLSAQRAGIALEAVPELNVRLLNLIQRYRNTKNITDDSAVNPSLSVAN